jgi:hypothetical protein
MENEFNYCEAAGYVIEKIGAKSIKRRLIVSKKYFREFTLPDYIRQWWPESPVPDADVLFRHITDNLRSTGKPDIVKELLKMKETVQEFENDIDSLLFYLVEP